MSKYMKADEVISLFEKYHFTLATRVSEFGYALRELPTVDAVEMNDDMISREEAIEIIGNTVCDYCETKNCDTCRVMIAMRRIKEGVNPSLYARGM